MGHRRILLLIRKAGFANAAVKNLIFHVKTAAKPTTLRNQK